MAAVEEALCAYLLTKTVVTDLIGSRLYADEPPQSYRVSAGTAASWEIVSSTDDMLLSDRAGLVHTRIQFVTYASTRKAANAAIRAIKNCGVCALKGVTSGVDIRGVSVDDGIRNYTEPPGDGSQELRYLAELDLMVDYLEAS